jgi:hypothetical protein
MMTDKLKHVGHLCTCVQVANLTLGTLVALFDTESWMMHDEGK